MLSLKQLAIALGGDVTGRKVLCPGPYHSRADRSLQVTLDPHMPDGFAVHSYAGDDFRVCRDDVRHLLGLPPFERGKSIDRPERQERPRQIREISDYSALAMNIWREAVNPTGTLVETYLHSRKVELPPAGGEVLRFAERCKFGDEWLPAMIALVRDARTNEPTGGIHRTALLPDGSDRVRRAEGETLRKALGPIVGGCVKLDDDADVETRLTIAEGIETALSARKCGYWPVWSAVNAGMLEKFPVLPIIETIFIIQEHDEASARIVKACARNWFEAGCDVIIVESDIGNDPNDELQEAC